MMPRFLRPPIVSHETAEISEINDNAENARREWEIAC